MNINSGIFLGKRNQVVMIKNNALWLLEPGCPPDILVEEMAGIRFLTACPHGIYLGFWADTLHSFRLIDISGAMLWSAWINEDKAIPHGIHFSNDAITCLFDFEFLPGIFFCDFNRGYTTSFGCSASPIGYEANLQYFAIDSCNPHENEKLAFFERESNSGNIVKVPPAAISEKMDQRPLLVDCNRCILPSPVVPVRHWDGLVIQGGEAGVERFVVLKEGDVQWIATDSTKPIVTIKDCVLEKENEEFFRCMFEVCGDNALIQSKTQAIVVNCTNGVIWRGSELDSVSLQGQRILAQYSDGSVEVIRSSGTIETKQLPLYGYRTIAMDTIEDTLKIAYYCDSRYAFEIRTFNLGDR